MSTTSRTTVDDLLSLVNGIGVLSQVLKQWLAARRACPAPSFAGNLHAVTLEATGFR